MLGIDTECIAWERQGRQNPDERESEASKESISNIIGFPPLPTLLHGAPPRAGAGHDANLPS